MSHTRCTPQISNSHNHNTCCLIKQYTSYCLLLCHISISEYMSYDALTCWKHESTNATTHNTCIELLYKSTHWTCYSILYSKSIVQILTINISAMVSHAWKWRVGENIIGLSKLWTRVVVAVPWSAFSQKSILLVNRHKCLYRKVALLLVRMFQRLSSADEDMKHSTDSEVTLESDKLPLNHTVQPMSLPDQRMQSLSCAQKRLSTNCPNLSTSRAFYLAG